MPHASKFQTIGVRTPPRVMLRPSPRFVRRLAAAVETLRHGVWSPVLGKALGIVGGMLALAAIGALATARGLGTHKTAFAEPSASHSLSHSPPTSRPLAAGMTPAPSDANAASAPAAPPPPSSEGVTAEGKIVLNRASVEELCRLPGVGPKRAQAIIDLRTKLGRFRRATDLLRIKGIGPKSLKRLEPFFVLDPPAAPAPAPSASVQPKPNGSANQGGSTK